jgi:hypothetical protein
MRRFPSRTPVIASEHSIAKRPAVNNAFSIQVGGNTLNLLALQANSAAPVSIGARNHR